MDRARALAAFGDYVGGYDPRDPMIRLKIDHTHRVAALAERVAGGLPADGLSDFAWLLGLLHDIGRFEQARRYGTFLDARSVDHAEFGADLLFREGLIDRFPAQGLPEGWQKTAETAIRLHNKLTLPEGLEGDALALTQVLRDADKLDIFRVVSETTLAGRMGRGAAALAEAEALSPAVLDCVKAHRCVPRDARRSALDVRASYCCMAFELVYPVSRAIAREQGYLLMLLELRDGGFSGAGPAARRQLDAVRREIEAAWGMPLSPAPGDSMPRPRA